jgi:hypothetical protein
MKQQYLFWAVSCLLLTLALYQSLVNHLTCYTFSVFNSGERILKSSYKERGLKGLEWI